MSTCTSNFNLNSTCSEKETIREEEQENGAREGKEIMGGMIICYMHAQICQNETH